MVGVAAVTLRYPALFLLFKIIGGTYLGYLGVQLWRSRGALAMRSDMSTGQRNMSARTLAAQGFVTAVANPKGWAFFIALLPPFIDYSRPLPGQLGILLSIVLAIEFISLIIYAGSGRAPAPSAAEKGQSAVAQPHRRLSHDRGGRLVGAGLSASNRFSPALPQRRFICQ